MSAADRKRREATPEQAVEVGRLLLAGVPHEKAVARVLDGDKQPVEQGLPMEEHA